MKLKKDSMNFKNSKNDRKKCKKQEVERYKISNNNIIQ